MIFAKTQIRVPSFCPWLDDPSTGYLRHRMNWLSLLSVCRHWRGVIANTPALWSTIDSHFKPKLFLKRAGTSILTIYNPVYIDGEHCRTWLETVAPLCDRFGQFHLYSCFGLREAQLLSSPAPQLISLSLAPKNLADDIPGSALPPIFDGKMPKLKMLTLGVFTSWPSGYFTGLTHLNLWGQPNSDRPSTSEFLDFLESSPRLEVLCLDCAGPTRDASADSPATPSSRIIDLPCLNELNIGDWLSVEVSRFLSHVKIPIGADMYIWGNNLLDPTEDLGMVIPAEHSHLANLHDISEWTLSRQIWRSRAIGPPYVAVERGSLHMFGLFAPSQVAPAASRYPLHNVQKFKVHDAHSAQMNVEIWRDIFLHLPNLNSLHITCDLAAPGLTRTLISALFPQPDEVLLCPLLCTLCIRNDPQLPTLHIDALAEERAKHGSPFVNLRVIQQPVGWGDDGQADEKRGKVTDDDVMFLKKHFRKVTVVNSKAQWTSPGEGLTLPKTFGSQLFRWTWQKVIGETGWR